MLDYTHRRGFLGKSMTALGGLAAASVVGRTALAGHRCRPRCGGYTTTSTSSRGRCGYRRGCAPAPSCCAPAPPPTCCPPPPSCACSGRVIIQGGGGKKAGGATGGGKDNAPPPPKKKKGNAPPGGAYYVPSRRRYVVSYNNRLYLLER